MKGRGGFFMVVFLSTLVAVVIEPVVMGLTGGLLGGQR